MTAGRIPDGLDDCPDAETLAAYLDGMLEPGERAQVERHAATCRDCRSILADAAGFMAEERERPGPAPAAQQETAAKVIPFRPRWRAGLVPLLTLAAALVAIVRLEPQWVPWGNGRTNAAVAHLVEAMDSQPVRPLEGRLSGGFAHRPPAGVMRGPAGRVAPEVQVAASEVALAASGTSAGQAAARGLASLTTGEIDQGITELESAVAAAPADAAYQNDLAAAYLARAVRTGNADDRPLALQAAGRALAANPAMPEALFNRALALNGVGSAAETQRAWAAYLAVDRNSEWASEARRKCPDC